MKKQKGTTLIALVITIIVMLILAGVSINMALGDNGILGKSKKARREKIVSEKIEEVKMAIASVVIENNGDGSTVIISSDSESNVIPKIRFNYLKTNEQNSITGLSTNEMLEEGMDDFDEDELSNLLGMVKYGKASTGLSEELMLIVDKDFNVEEYVGGVVSPYNDLPEVALYTSEYSNHFGGVYCFSPDLSGFNPESTYYVTYDSSGNEKIAGRIDRVGVPDKWFDYENKKWANVVTVTGNDVSYWTWIPRYKYTSDSASSSDESIITEFVNISDECLDKSGQPVDVSSYKLPESFRFGDGGDAGYTALKGYWMSKYELQE